VQQRPDLQILQLRVGIVESQFAKDRRRAGLWVHCLRSQPPRWGSWRGHWVVWYSGITATRSVATMLYLSLLIMGVSTPIIGILPTYETLGIWAAILLISCRLLQGFGLGGEWGGAVLMAVEPCA
jgi:MFS family permease